MKTSFFKFGKTLDDVIEDLKSQMDSQERGQTYQHIPEKPASKTRRKQPAAMSPGIMEAVLQLLRPHQPYGHQLESWEALYAGRSLVLTTPTASGKTMCFNPPILDAVVNEQASALYVFPLVDLATSQQHALQALRESLSQSRQEPAPRIVGLHSGDSDGWKEKRIGNQDFVLTTPESLHRSILPQGYPNWRSFFKRLRYVVLDEAHVYSGLFGTNMAFILRRLAHRCLREGGRIPQFIVCSATIREPAAFARQLLPPGIERPHHIHESSARSPARHEIAFLAQPKVLPDLFVRPLDTSITDQQGNRRRLRTILFMNSRRGVSRFTNQAKASLERHGRRDLISAFAGYMAGQANAVDTFEQLMRGELSSIVTTNKLAAGIDIGDLDVSIVYGFQRRFLDMRQMFGRAGRKNAGAWIFVGNPRSLEDQFVVDSFPEVFECREPEATVVTLNNDRLRDAHLACLNGRVPGKAWMSEGPAHPKYVQQLFPDSHRWVPGTGPADPWNTEPLDCTKLQLRGANVLATYTFSLDGKVEKGDDAHQVPQYLAYRDYHPGSIFQLDGRVYRTEKLVQQPRPTIVAKQTTDTHLRTRCQEATSATLTEETTRATRGPLRLVHGRFHIQQSFASYSLMSLKEAWLCPRRGCENERSQDSDECPTHRRRFRYVQTWKELSRETMDPPLSLDLHTVGVEFDLSNAGLARVGEPDDELASVAEELLKAIITIVVNSYEDAFLAEGEILAGLITGPGTILFYDNFPGGIGIASALFEDESGLIWQKALERVQKCRCLGRDGCVECVLPPFAREGETANKPLVLRALETIVSRQGKPLPTNRPVEATAATAPPARKTPNQSWSVGDKAKHAQFGVGEVIKIADWRPGHQLLTVRFPAPHFAKTLRNDHVELYKKDALPARPQPTSPVEPPRAEHPAADRLDDAPPIERPVAANPFEPTARHSGPIRSGKFARRRAAPRNCAVCRKPIPSRRVAALPRTSRCIECATSDVQPAIPAPWPQPPVEYRSCPRCGSNTCIRGEPGDFFIACEAFPRCRWTRHYSP